MVNSSKDNFTFDYVVSEETPQVEIFEKVGRQIID